MNSKQFLYGAEKSFPFRVLSGEGLDREITDPCAFVYDGTTDFWRGIKSGRIVIVPPDSLDSFSSDINPHTSCLFISGSDSCPSGFMKSLAEKSIPVVVSNMGQQQLASRVTGLLREKLESTIFMHGSMVVYKRTGALIIGESGAGKSRCCLDLLGTGARLVADDLVEIKKEGGKLYGKSPWQIRHMIEIRQTGLKDVRSLFGERAAADRSAIDIVFEIAAPETAESYAGPYAELELMDVIDVMDVKVPLKRIRAGGVRTVSELVRHTCEERCQDNCR